MTTLPLTKMTLYKHGVGFFERRAQFSGTEATLSFRVEEMNDILKSLTAIDWGAGQVLGVGYATPQDKEALLAGSSIRLDDKRSLRDLLICLRGRQVTLLLDQDETWPGTLVGIDEPEARQPLDSALVSLLRAESENVLTVPLSRVHGVQLQDEQAATDLRFFLETSLSQEAYRQVTISLSDGDHDLSVSYVAPAPTWRVSYRIVAEPDAEGGPSALLFAWGIFDNRMEEDLQEISLSLVAGMPISFVYDLYTPFTPERPVVEEEARVAAGPVAFGAAMMPDAPMMADMARAPMEAMAMPAPAPAARRLQRKELLETTAPVASGEALGELFQYNITTPVTVRRGQSAMVPIIAADLAYRKELLYNGQQLPAHPVATMRFRNSSGLTLERGPVTVIDGGDYVGEAILPFTAREADFNVPYAVELGVTVHEDGGSARQISGLHISGAYLVVEEWNILWREYRVANNTDEEKSVLVEHPRQTDFELFDSPAPVETTETHFRFMVQPKPRSEGTIRAQTRRLMSRREQLERQSYAQLQRYLHQGLLDKERFDKVAELLRLWEQIGDAESRQKEVDQERQQIFKAQQQIQGNMSALGQSGREGTLRTRYVSQLESHEERLREIEVEERRLKQLVEQMKQTVEKKLASLS